jgi:ribonuclease P protein component
VREVDAAADAAMARGMDCWRAVSNRRIRDLLAPGTTLAGARPGPIPRSVTWGAFEEAMREEDVSAEQSETEEEARLPYPHAHARGSRSDRPAAGEGPQPPVVLIWRVRGRRSFQALARGQRRRADGLEVTVAELGPITDPPRVAYAVSRAVGSAVARNRARRRLREAVRESAGLLQRGRGYLVRPLAGFDGVPQSELASTLRTILGDLT